MTRPIIALVGPVSILLIVSSLSSVKASTNSTQNYTFIEDSTEKPETATIDMILQYCLIHPQGNITTDLVDNGMISTFYVGYTCAQASQYKQRLDLDTKAAEGFQDFLDAYKKYGED